jgi:hypothetical protein
MKRRIGCVVFGCLLLVLSMAAQTPGNSPAAAQVPPLIQFSSVATDEGGNTLSGVVNLTFTLYAAQQGGEPLWTETQNNIPLDPTGHYSVQLGVTKRNGVPTTFFTTGEARWLGVRIAEQAEQPRVLLLSVPYALKAGDAATIGGLPPSAFVLAAPGTDSSGSGATVFAGSGASSSDAPPAGGVTGSGTADYVPLWTTASNIGNSVLFQSGTGKTAKVGINTITPASTLDVKGTATIRGLFSLPATGTATATKGANSQAEELTASAFNSGTGTAVTQNFQWRAEPVGNDTGTASGALHLLFGQGANKLAETGLNIASNGQITFATGQTFPGTGDGTVTSVGTGLGLSGGPITDSGTLTIDTGVVPQLAAANTFKANQTVNGSVTATSFSGNGSSVTNVNASQLGGLASGAFAQLSAANAFTANQTVTGSVTATSFSGNGSALTNVTAANSSELGGLAPSAFAQLSANNTFTGNQTVNGSVTVTSGASNDIVSNMSAATGSAVVGNSTATTGAPEGVLGLAASTSGVGVIGYAIATTGSTVGVGGRTDSPNGAGVYGTASAVDTGVTYGVYGVTGSPAGAGTFGVNSSLSTTGKGELGTGAGVWGDAGDAGALFGVLGSADDAYAGAFENNSNTLATLYAQALNGAGFPFWATGTGAGSGYCNVDAFGDLNCTGTVNGGMARIDGGARKVALSAIESPKNWFEDAGAAQLVNGSAVVALDADFIQTVNTEMDYKVFPVPNGDCKGLYVTNKTRTSFEVRELGGGTSSIRFDYRIMALRKHYENVRFADHTNDPDPSEMMLKRAQPGKPEAKPVMAPLAALQKQPATTRAEAQLLSVPSNLKTPALPASLLTPSPAQKESASQK